MKVGFIGTGHIAAPMARALARDGHQVTVSQRNAEVSESLADAGLGISVGDNQSVLDACEVVFLCLRPAVWASVVQDLRWRTDHQIVSVMAGVALGEITRACGGITAVSATIPFGFIETGGCPLPVAGDPGVLTTLFGARNPVLPQPEEKFLQYHFAVSGLVAGVLGVLEASADWLTDQTGDAAKAERYTSALIAGVLGNLDGTTPGHITAERQALASPNTLNLQMFEGLGAAGTYVAVQETLFRISSSMEGDA